MIKKLLNKWTALPVQLRATSAYTICSILQKCLSFITMPLFTRLLTTEQYGQYSVYTSWSGILVIFLTLYLGYGSFSTAMVKFEDDRRGYVCGVQGVCCVLTLLFLAIYLLFYQKIYQKNCFMGFIASPSSNSITSPRAKNPSAPMILTLCPRAKSVEIFFW